MKSLTRARSGEDTRKFVELRATALVITVALFIAIAALMILLVFGSQIQEALLPPLASDVTSPLVTVGRYVGAVLVLQLLFAFIYWVGPDRARRPRWQWVSPGAALGVVGWLLVSYGFSLYTRYFGTYAENPAYTGIAGVIVLLLWLQLTMALLLVGAEVNFVREARRRARADIRDGAGFGLIDPVAALGDADLAPPEPVAEPVPMAPADRSERVRSGPASAPSVGRYAPPPALSDAGRRDGLVRAGLGLLGTAAALITVVRARHRRRS